MENLKNALKNSDKEDYSYDFTITEEELKILIGNKRIFVLKRNPRGLYCWLVGGEVLVTVLTYAMILTYLGNIILAIAGAAIAFVLILLLVRSLSKAFLVIGPEGFYSKKYVGKPTYIPWTDVEKINTKTGRNINFHVRCYLVTGRKKKFYPGSYMGNEYRGRIIAGSKAYKLMMTFYRLFEFYWQKTQVTTAESAYKPITKAIAQPTIQTISQPTIVTEAEPQGLSCPNCGKENALEAEFCEGCGSELATQDVVESVPFDAGKKEKFYVMTRVPTDFSIFLDKFSEAFMSYPIKTDKFKFDNKNVKIEKHDLERGIKEVVYQLKVKTSKIFAFITLNFVPTVNGTNMDVYMETELEGQGIMTERIVNMIQNYGLFSSSKFRDRIIEAINESL